ncbi:RRXRR domain-containing protein [Coleofasciculus sp. LEGE 07081]|uniref:RRXRR domain-containing protein n=1 Tax=unclassified Coleofasciculus TaxID=2692782 RepID=UPI001D15D104
MLRIPVVSPDGKPLMPTKPSRARRWLRDNLAVKKWSDVGLFYIQLTQQPSGEKTQPVALGVDPGKSYSGIGIQSPRVTLFMAHLVLPFQSVKDRMEQRRMMRLKGRRGWWEGNVSITAAAFFVIVRPPTSRRQLHLMIPSKGGKRRKYGGTTTRHGFRKGDVVRTQMARRVCTRWVSGDTHRRVSVSDITWKRLGQFSASKVQLLCRATGLLVSDSCYLSMTGISNPSH